MLFNKTEENKVTCMMRVVGWVEMEGVTVQKMGSKVSLEGFFILNLEWICSKLKFPSIGVLQNKSLNGLSRNYALKLEVLVSLSWITLKKNICTQVCRLLRTTTKLFLLSASNWASEYETGSINMLIVMIMDNNLCCLLVSKYDLGKQR